MRKGAVGGGTGGVGQLDPQMTLNILKNYSQPVAVYDATGKIIFWNRGAEQLYGYPEKETLGKKISKIFPSRAREEVKEIINRVLSGGTVEDQES